MGKKLKTKSKILRKWAKKHGIKQVNLKLSDYPDTDVRGLPAISFFDELPCYDFGVPGQAKTEAISPKFSAHKMKPGKKGKAIPAKETFMKTKVEVGPEVRASDFKQVFLPKDRDGALMLIKHELYHWLHRHEELTERYTKLNEIRASALENNICEDIRNLLDLIERS